MTTERFPEEQVVVELDNGFQASYDLREDTSSYIQNLIAASQEYLDWRKENGYE